MWLGYCCLITGFAYLAVPALNAKAAMIKRLDHFYAEHLLTSDKQVLQISVITDQLYSKLFPIGCGWAYTKLVSVECKSDFSSTCPDDFEYYSVVGYLAIVVAYVTIAAFAYHEICNVFRLQSRTMLVRSIEEEDVEMLFKGVNTDCNGRISLDELKTFLVDSGLDSKLFMQAFENVVAQQGVLSEVLLVDLVHEFTRSVTYLKKQSMEKGVTTAEERQLVGVEAKQDTERTSGNTQPVFSISIQV